MRKTIGFLFVLLFVTSSVSAQEYGPSAPTPGVIANAGPTNPPIPIPPPPFPPLPPQPLTVTGVVQTMHGASLSSGGRNVQMWLTEKNPYSGTSSLVAGTQCPFTPPPSVGPPAPQYPQGCADNNGLFRFIGGWQFEPLDATRTHWLAVAAEGFLVREVQIPIGVPDVNLGVINLESSPIETVRTSGALVAGNKFMFFVDMKKIVPDPLDVMISVNVSFSVAGGVQYFTAYPVPSHTGMITRFSTSEPFLIDIPESLRFGAEVYANITVSDIKKPWITYGLAYAQATK